MSRSDWLKGATLPLLLALLRVLWLSPVLELLRRWLAPDWPPPLLSVLLMLAVYLASVGLTRLVLGPIWKLAQARILVALAGFAVIYLVLWWQFYRPYAPWDIQWVRAMGDELVRAQSELPPAYLAIPALIYLWLQGILDGRCEVYRDDVWQAFAIGFVALVICMMLAVADGRGAPAGMSTLVFSYFGIGMAALALSSLETVRGLAGRRGNGQVEVNRYWLVSVASVIAILLLIGLGLSLVVHPEIVARAFSWMTALLQIVGTVLYYVLLVFAFVIFLFLDPLIKLLQGMAKTNTQDQQPQPLTTDVANQLDQLRKGSVALPSQVTALLPWLGLAAALLAIGLLFAWALRRFQERAEKDEDETREIILSRDLLEQQLAALLSSLRRRPGAAGGLGLRFLSLYGEMEARRLVRALYQDMLARMSARGQQRERSQTPQEYAAALEGGLPGSAPALSTVTGVYMQARYAGEPPTAADVKDAQQAWQEISDALKPDEPENQSGATPAGKR